MIARTVAALFAAATLAGIAACAQPTAGSPVPADTPTSVAPTTEVPAQTRTSTAPAPPPVTVVVPPPSTVYVPEPDPDPYSTSSGLTPCQSMAADGFTYDYAYSAWVDAGYPDSWDADVDGYPCEQSFGEQN